MFRENGCLANKAIYRNGLILLGYSLLKDTNSSKGRFQMINQTQTKLVDFKAWTLLFWINLAARRTWLYDKFILTDQLTIFQDRTFHTIWANRMPTKQWAWFFVIISVKLRVAQWTKYQSAKFDFFLNHNLSEILLNPDSPLIKYVNFKGKNIKIPQDPKSRLLLSESKFSIGPI